MGLGIEWPVLVSQLVSFLAFFLIMRFAAYKPILKILDERSRKIKESLLEAESVREQSTHAEEEIKKQIQIASQQGQEILARATKAGEEIRQRAQEQAKQEAGALIIRAREEIISERDEAIDILRNEFADLTIRAAGKVIGQTLDKQAHSDLINKVLQESKTLKKG